MIETRDLVYTYDNDSGSGSGSGSESDSRAGGRALDGVSLAIDDGAFVLLVGPNGSGKTTLVRQFNGLLEPDAGEVRVDGQPVGDDLVAARTAVGMVFQDPRDGFVAATVAADVAFGPENLGLPRNDIDDRVADALAAVRMAGRGDERIDELSGGEQARVAIAGALAMRPSHLVLDEPLAGLDWPSRQAVVERLAQLSRDGTGVIVVTHDLRDLAEHADRVVALADGRVALDTPPAEAADGSVDGLADGFADRLADRLAKLGVRPP